MISDRVFSLLEKVISIITLQKVIIWGLAALMSIIAFTIYENRNMLVKQFSSDKIETTVPFIVSETSKTHVKLLTNNDIVVAVIVMNVDIRNNRRIPLYWYAPDAIIQGKLDTLFVDKFSGIPLFTSAEKNNENIVSVINGEFSCNPYAGFESVFTGLQHKFPFVCTTSLPPYYGAFAGYITVALNRQPEQIELDKLKVETVNLSTDIYFRDVMPLKNITK